MTVSENPFDGAPELPPADRKMIADSRAAIASGQEGFRSAEEAAKGAHRNSPTPLTPAQRALVLIHDLDSIARDVDQCEYGLPIYSDGPLPSLIDKVAAALHEAERAAVARMREAAARVVEDCEQCGVRVGAARIRALPLD